MPSTTPERLNNTPVDAVQGVSGNGAQSTLATAPPAQQRRPRRWPWVVFLLVVTIVALGIYRRHRLATGETIVPRRAGGGGGNPAARTIPVIAATAQRGDLPIYLDGLGTVTAFNTVVVHSRVEGQLIKVSFSEGQLVKAGDILAEVDPRPYQAELDTRIAAVGQAQAQVELAQITLTHLKEINQEFASDIEFQQAEAAQHQAQAMLAGAKASVDAARLNLEWCHITAPIGGRIGLRMVDQGNLVHINDPAGMAVITQLQPISVVFSLPQEVLPRVLNATSKVPDLSAEAYSSDLKTRLAVGKLQAVDNQIDTGTGTAKLKAAFENQESNLFPNQFVNIRLLVDMRTAVVLAPTAAIQRSPQSTFAYVVKSDETVEIRPITLGPTEAGQSVIETGLEPGELIVTDGVDKLVPGSKVSVRSGRDVSSQPTSEPTTQASASTKPAQPGDAAPPAGERKRGAGGGRPKREQP